MAERTFSSSAPPAVYAAARRAYERGRRRRAAPFALLALPVVALAVRAGADLVSAGALGVALCVVLFALAVRGRGAERVLLPAVALGALPLLFAVVPVPHACAGGVCAQLCAPLCFFGGALTGGAAALKGGRTFVALSGVALLASLLACLPLGAGAALGSAVGLMVGALPLAVRSLRWS